jgi:hypothetical protein
MQTGINTDYNTLIVDRMRGTGGLTSQSTNGENGYWGPISGVTFDDMDSFATGWPVGASSYSGLAFKRAPGFFDIMAYAGNSSARSIDHNLDATPELVIIKNRGLSSNWPVYYSGATAGSYPLLNRDLSAGARGYTITTSDTQLTFNNGDGDINSSGYNYIAYLFATVPGISKVGSYTGNGSTLNVNCGFSSGARFVLVKAVSHDGHWILFDSARGIVAGNDVGFYPNSSSAPLSGYDLIDPLSSGFTINNAGVNSFGGPNRSGYTYIFLAIA